MPGNDELVLIGLNSAATADPWVQTDGDHFVSYKICGHGENDRAVIGGDFGRARMISAAGTGDVNEAGKIGNCSWWNILKADQHKPGLGRGVL